MKEEYCLVFFDILCEPLIEYKYFVNFFLSYFFALLVWREQHLYAWEYHISLESLNPKTINTRLSKSSLRPVLKLSVYGIKWNHKHLFFATSFWRSFEMKKMIFSLKFYHFFLIWNDIFARGNFEFKVLFKV